MSADLIGWTTTWVLGTRWSTGDFNSFWGKGWQIVIKQWTVKDEINMVYSLFCATKFNCGGTKEVGPPIEKLVLAS